MAKVRLPLLGLGASGTIGEALTYASWRGIDYVRERVIPQNPQTVAQTAVRDTFTSLNTIWTFIGALSRAPWTLTAAGRPVTDRNLHISRNLAALIGDADMVDYVWSPATNAPFTPAISSVTPGAQSLTIVATAPAFPTGWTAVAMVARVMADLDPQTGVWVNGNNFGEVEDLTAPYSLVISGLITGQLYRIAVWMRLTSPELDTRYSLVAESTGTPI